MRVRLKYSKSSSCRFLSHLDLMRTFIRALRRARVPVALTQGYNPQPRLTFAAPLPVGTSSSGDYLDLFLRESQDVDSLILALNSQLPAGIRIAAGKEVEMGQIALMASVNYALYKVEVEGVDSDVAVQEVKKLLEAKEVIVPKKTKKGIKYRDIKPFIHKLSLLDNQEEGDWYLEMALTIGSQGSLRPEEVLKAMGFTGHALIGRVGIFIKKGERTGTPFDDI